jgi:hypothetical protein
MSAYIAELKAETSATLAAESEKIRVAAVAVKDRLTPLETRLVRLLTTIPIEVQREGLSLPILQASLRGKWRGNCHPGELGKALQKLGFRRERRWRSGSAFIALWFPRG